MPRQEWNPVVIQILWTLRPKNHEFKASLDYPLSQEGGEGREKRRRELITPGRGVLLSLPSLSFKLLLNIRHKDWDLSFLQAAWIHHECSSPREIYLCPVGFHTVSKHEELLSCA